MNEYIFYYVQLSIFMYIHIDVNPGGWGRDPQILGWGNMGGSWAGLGKYYSLFCTKSMLESGFFKEN